MKLTLLILCLSIVYCNGFNQGAELFRSFGIRTAIENGNLETFQELFNEYSKNHPFNLAFFIEAAAKADPKIVEIFLRANGSDINQSIDSFTPIFYAATNENEDVIDMFIKNGAKVNEVGRNGVTPLHLASINSNEKVIEKLLSSNANISAVDHKGDSPLSWAATNPNEKVTEILIKKGANIDHKNIKGETPLSIAAFDGQYYLLINILFKLLAANERVVELLIKSGSNVNEQNYLGFTPIFSAVFNGNAMLRDFIKDDGRKTIWEPYGETKRREHLLKLLESPAQAHAGERIIEVLLNNGVDINQKATVDQITPYEAVELIGNEDMKAFLIEHGANAKKSEI